MSSEVDFDWEAEFPRAASNSGWVQIPRAILDLNLPVVAQLGDIDFNVDRLVAVSATGSGKSICMPAAEAAMRKSSGEKVQVLVRQPTRTSCASIHRSLAKFWSDSGLTFGICTSSKKENLDADVVLYSDGSLKHLLKEGSGKEPPIIYMDEVHSLGNRLAELDLSIAKMRGLRIRALSATVDPSTIIEYFGPGTKQYELSGRTFPIEREVMWVSEDAFDRGESLDGFMAAMSQVVDTTVAEGGRSLVFVPTKALCEQAAAAFSDLLPTAFAHGDVYPDDLLDWVEKHRAGPFVVFCTISLATGVTLPLDRTFVWDEREDSEMRNGILRKFARTFDSNSLIQCSGRVGRTHPGKATLITSTRRRPYGWEHIRPEPVDTPCAKETPFTVVLMMAQEGIADLSRIDLLSKLDMQELEHARKWLMQNRCLYDDGSITPLGRRVNAFPLDAREAHMVLSARGRDAQLAILAAFVAGGQGFYGALRVKPDKAPDGFPLLPPDCVVRGSMPLTLAKLVQRAFAARDRTNSDETLAGWCEANNLNRKPMEFTLRQFEEVGQHICPNPRLELMCLDLSAIEAAVHSHLKSHPLFSYGEFPSEWGRVRNVSAVIDSAAYRSFDCDGHRFRAWGIEAERKSRRGSIFTCLNLPIVEFGA